MVIAQVVHVRNQTARTFYIKAGDTLYSNVKVAGESCAEGVLHATPGFDEDTEGLVIPWETVTRYGLEIRQEGSDEVLRCVLGPKEGDADGTAEWLQFRSDDWTPLKPDKWRSLGRRHYLGTVGKAVDMFLIFREVPFEGSSLVNLTHFDHASQCVPPNVVLLNVFDLVSAAAIPNAILNNTLYNTFGAFHTAVEVYREEWAFYRTPAEGCTGVVRSPKPKEHPVHVFRQSVVMGTTHLKDWEVRYLIASKLKPKWMGTSYQLLRRNCIHFCDDFLLCLGVRGVPSWIKGLHETGATVFQLPWPLSTLFGGRQQAAIADELEQEKAPPRKANSSNSIESDENEMKISHEPSVIIEATGLERRIRPKRGTAEGVQEEQEDQDGL
mmetsp:Transcript_5289/g.12654  ORF Transcript_5289/g.12654 Transcript_5289/m.12654 type:complete len:383 (+) Transcript_5289:292-1440(+)